MTKKKTKKQLAYEEARKALYASYGGVKKKKFKELGAGSYEWKERSSGAYKSLESDSIPSVCGRTNMMEPMILQRESPEVQEAILNKASRLLPQYNKGAYQYTPESIQLSDTGRKK